MDADLEACIRGHLDARDFSAAATLGLAGYGPGVYRFLHARLHDQDRADEAFAELGEDVWRGIAGFRGDGSFLSWIYALARNAAHRVARARGKRERRQTTASRLAGVLDEVRARTAPYLRTDVKERFRAIQETLSEDERALLHLRIDQSLPWTDIAKIMGGEPSMNAAEVTRVSARMRKRFSLLVRRLREVAEAEGLLDDAGEG
jgi:RNA polymerase sigma-70 factor (ECF subfamily)